MASRVGRGWSGCRVGALVAARSSGNDCSSWNYLTHGCTYGTLVLVLRGIGMERDLFPLFRPCERITTYINSGTQKVRHIVTHSCIILAINKGGMQGR